MKINNTPYKKIETEYVIKHNGSEYRREEVTSTGGWIFPPSKKPTSYKKITWSTLKSKNKKALIYERFSSGDGGWMKDNKYDKKNPVPEIEKLFQKTIKDEM